MTTVRLIITLKSGVLDAQGQAIRQGLRALGYNGVSAVKAGRYLELTVPEDLDQETIQEICERFLANPLIEEWRIESAVPEAPPDGTLPGRPYSGAH